MWKVWGITLGFTTVLTSGRVQDICDTANAEIGYYNSLPVVYRYDGLYGVVSRVKGGLKYKEIKTFTAEEANQWFVDNVKPDYKPPYKPGTVVKEIELTEKTTFVRVYDNMPDGSGMYGSWVMRAEDIEGLTPVEIKNKFALPNTPKYICDVELEAGTHIRVGKVNSVEGWGSGGGTQYDLIGQRIGNFKNERLLEEY